MTYYCYVENSEGRYVWAEIHAGSYDEAWFTAASRDDVLRVFEVSLIPGGMPV